ncbi:MAG: hypothetical protein ABI693_07260 [Bryobacteraceae bacterium]
MIKSTALLCALLLLSPAIPCAAAPRESVRMNWAGLQKEITSRNLVHKSVHVVLTGGGEVKTTLEGITETGVLVNRSRRTRQWTDASGKVLIPKDRVAAIRLGGHVGKARLIGALGGLGAGAAIGAAIATSADGFEGILVVLIPVSAACIGIIGGVAGYFIGRAIDRPGPEFVVVP